MSLPFFFKIFPKKISSDYLYCLLICFLKFQRGILKIKKVILHEGISIYVRKLFYFTEYLSEELENTTEEDKELFQLRLSENFANMFTKYLPENLENTTEEPFIVF